MLTYNLFQFAFEAPEVAAVAKYLKSQEIIAFIDVHSCLSPPAWFLLSLISLSLTLLRRL